MGISPRTIAFSCPALSCPAISCHTVWSAKFMSCHFQVLHFQRIPTPSRKPTDVVLNNYRLAKTFGVFHYSLDTFCRCLKTYLFSISFFDLTCNSNSNFIFLVFSFHFIRF